MRFRKIITILLCSIMLTGCWDKIEIDRKSLVSIIGVDVGEDIDKSKELKKLNPESSYNSMNFKNLHVTYGYPDVSKIAPEKGGNSENVYIEADGYSMEDSLVKAASKSSRIFSLSHSKLLIISRELLNTPEVFKEVTDYFQREPSLNKMMYIAVSEGKASDYMKYKPIMEQNLSKYLEGLVINSPTGDNVFPVALNEFLTLLSQNGNATLPSLSYNKEKKELMLAGVVIVKDYTYKGYLSPSETSTLEILRGKIEQGKKVIYWQGHPVDISISSVERKIKFTGDKSNIAFNIILNIEAQIKGVYTGKSVSEEKTINFIQDSFNKSIKEECENLIENTQKNFMVDPIGFRENLEKYHPSIWKEVKDKWPETYKNSKINVIVKTNIRRVGVVK